VHLNKLSQSLDHKTQRPSWLLWLKSWQSYIILSTNQWSSLVLAAVEHSQLVLIQLVQLRKTDSVLVVQTRETYTVPATSTKPKCQRYEGQSTPSKLLCCWQYLVNLPSCNHLLGILFHHLHPVNVWPANSSHTLDWSGPCFCYSIFIHSKYMSCPVQLMFSDNIFTFLLGQFSYFSFVTLSFNDIPKIFLIHVIHFLII